MTTVEIEPNLLQRVFGLKRREPVPVHDGQPIQHRTVKQVAWSVVLGTLAFGLLASGLYFGVTQVHWYLPFGPLWLQHGFDNKLGWDSGMGIIHPRTWLINTANWPEYRHPYRDIGLPALATMGALSIAGGARKPASRWYTAIAPILVLVTAVVLITAGTWLRLRVTPVGAAAIWTVVGSLVLGLVIGKVLHYIWRPAGTRIQTFLVERLVDRYFRKGGTGQPVWVRHELVPPTAVEEAVILMRKDEGSGEADDLRAEGQTSRSRGIYVLAAVAVLLLLAVDFVGFIGHFWDGVLGLHFPYLAP